MSATFSLRLYDHSARARQLLEAWLRGAQATGQSVTIFDIQDVYDASLQRAAIEASAHAEGKGTK